MVAAGSAATGATEDMGVSEAEVMAEASGAEVIKVSAAGVLEAEVSTVDFVAGPGLALARGSGFMTAGF